MTAVHRLTYLAGIVVFALASMARAETPATRPTAAEPLITVAKGDLPIIITAPHGGRTVIENTPARKGVGADRFVAGGDTNTYELAMKIADGLEKELGKRPYIVFAKFQRKFADANRDPKNAYEHPNAQFHYDAFHVAVDAATKDIKKRWGRGLLIDVHGQVAEVDGIFRGTRDGKSCTDLIKREGLTAVIGPKSIFGQFAEMGYPIFPKPEKDALGTEVKYNGGYITEHYGSHNGTSIDAIQLEFGGNLRKQDKIDKTAKDATTAITTFAKAYLPAPAK